MTKLLRATRTWPLALTAVLLLSVGAAPAGASSEIEGIWSFNGGEVAIHAVAGGKFEGVVVTPTKFAECTHQVAEKIWSAITPQTDGSFWGFHQWLFEGSCAPNPEPGPTAWRVLHAAGGARFLKVCFSEPTKSQPTISPSGAAAGASFGCEQSSPTAPLPVVVSSPSTSSGQSGEVVSFAGTLRLPNTKLCLRRGTIKIKIADPKRDPLKEVVIRIKRRKIADVRGVARLQHGIVLKGLPGGSFTLKIVATTILDQKLTGKRSYHRCGRHRGHKHGAHHHTHGRRH